MKKFLSIFLVFSMLLSISPTVFSFDDESNLLIAGDFEDEEEAEKYYSGGFIDSAAAYEGFGGIQVSNPYGNADFEVSDHILEYNEPITLTEGEFYTFSAYVLNPLSESDKEPSATASLNNGGSTLFIDISNVGGEWGFVSVSFMPTRTGDYYLSVMLKDGDPFVGFFMDCITLQTAEKVPKYAALSGPDVVFVPESGFLDYRYSLVTYDSEGELVNVLLRELNITAENMPDGIEFIEEEGVLRVYSNTEANVSFSLVCSASVGVPLTDGVVEIRTTKNILENPSFDEEDLLWESDSPLTFEDGCISLYAENSGYYGKYASVQYTKQLPLTAGKMYVFRADVKSEDGYEASDVYISNTSFASSGYAEINITGIGGGEWSSVVSAFTVENSGIYELTLNLYAPSERPVYLDNVSLATEEPSPTRISLHAPGNIQLPEEDITLPCYAVLHDQMGNSLDIDIDIDISPKKSGIYISDGTITVTKDAKCGEYLLSASYGELEGEISVTVSRDGVGDGGFEEKAANEWWAASDGALFSIVDYGDNLWGYVLSDESECLVLNNSYMELLGGEYYVYSASAGIGKACTVTAFIADTITGEYIPIAQYDPLNDVIEPFFISERVVGRLVLYIESDDAIALTMDDIKIEQVDLSAENVYITGYEDGDTLRGYYDYINNMTLSPDADISVLRWYISSTFDGYYEPVGIPNQSRLKCTDDMVGQYVLFEVTPVCSVTGLVGDSVRSEPVLIGSSSSSSSVASGESSSSVSPVIVESSLEHPFTDITGHWAESRIGALFNAGIISGRSATKFDPEANVTRAEFTAMITRAFSLVSVPYSGQFSDVSENDWFSGSVEAAFRRSLISGISDSMFAPNELITREQMASIVYRAYIAAGGEEPFGFDLMYYDSFMISSWAKESVRNVSSLGLFSGTDMNLFEPQRPATRAEAASVIYRLLRKFN